MIKQATPSLILASVLVGFIAGVAFSSWFVGWAVVVGAVVLVDLAFLGLRRAAWRDRLLLVGLLLFGLVTGHFRYVMSQPGVNSLAAYTGSHYAITGTIAKHEGDVSRQKLTLNQVSLDGVNVTGRMLVFAPGYPKLKTGQQVQVSCVAEAPEPFDGFHYERYLASKRIYATCFVREAPFVLGVSPRFVGLDRLHESAVAQINQLLGEPQSALLAGLLMGDNNFSDEWKGYFLSTGTSHVVAASGYNVSMLAIVLLAVLVSLGFRRQQAFPLIVLGIAAFVIIAGAEAAVTRAGIMGVLALSATQLGRKTTVRNIILLTVVGMLLLEPRLLRDDVGFQLSVLSTIGLITMARYFSEKFAFIPEALGLKESFAATIAATLATLPVIILGFGKISIISPFVNLLILPFVPYAMLFGLIATVVGVIDQGLGALIMGPAWICLTAMLKIIQAMAALPFAIVKL
ncbi:MAG: ComEC/Rec2 family competence protein [Patescibacteria group bacterium]